MWLVQEWEDKTTNLRAVLKWLHAPSALQDSHEKQIMVHDSFLLSSKNSNYQWFVIAAFYIEGIAL